MVRDNDDLDERVAALEMQVNGNGVKGLGEKVDEMYTFMMKAQGFLKWGLPLAGLSWIGEILLRAFKVI